MRQYPIGLEDGWSVKQRYVHFMNACWEDNHEIVRGLGDCGWKKKQDEGDSSDNVEEIQHRTTGKEIRCRFLPWTLSHTMPGLISPITESELDAHAATTGSSLENSSNDQVAWTWTEPRKNMDRQGEGGK